MKYLYAMWVSWIWKVPCFRITFVASYLNGNNVLQEGSRKGKHKTTGTCSLV